MQFGKKGLTKRSDACSNNIFKLFSISANSGLIILWLIVVDLKMKFIFFIGVSLLKAYMWTLALYRCKEG